jgi:hypothetical protein
LSPLFFVLAIDLVNRILAKATEQEILHPLHGRTMPGTSLYADDVTIFVAPIKEDISCLPSILGTFGDATGSCANSQKKPCCPDPM